MRAQSLLCAQYFTGNQYVCALLYVIFRVTFEQYDVGELVRKGTNLFRKRMYLYFVGGALYNFLAVENVKTRNKY
jgi:hypothetical protein